MKFFRPYRLKLIFIICVLVPVHLLTIFQEDIMKRVLLIIIGYLAVLCYAPAAHCNNLYIGGNIGLALVNDSDLDINDLQMMLGMPADVSIEFDKGFAIGGAVGYDFGAFRLEGEVAYQKSDLDKLTVSADGMGGSAKLSGDGTSLALLANGYYDFHNDSAFTPYVSAGIGFAKVSINDFGSPSLEIPSSGDEDDTVFAYQVGLGLGYAVTDNWIIEVKYRYFGTADPEFEGLTAEFSSHNILAGVRFSF